PRSPMGVTDLNSGSMRRRRELVDRSDVPLVGLYDGGVLAVLVNPAVDCPAHPGVLLVNGGRPVGPARDAAQVVLLGERLADGVMLQQALVLQDGEITGGVSSLIHTVL